MTAPRQGWQWAHTWDGRKVAAETRDAALAGLRAGADTILAESQRRVPRDTGELANSAAVSLDRGQGAASIHYGTDHAVVVHEKTTLHHEQGQAKFLESALGTAKEAALRAVADQVKRTLS